MVKIRCSSLGKFIGKRGELIGKSELNKIYLDWTDLFSNDYVEKGIYCESESLDMYQTIFNGGKTLLRNKKHFENEFIQGTPDVIIKNELIVDIKNAFNKLTFLNAELSWLYEWQLKGYMWLTGIYKARLFYTLNQTPDFIMSRLEQKLFYAGNHISMESESYKQDLEILHQQHDISTMALEERFKFWDIELTDDDIETMEKVVIDANNYMELLDKIKQAHIEKNKILLYEF